MHIYKTFLKIALRCMTYGLMYISIFLGVSFAISKQDNSDSAASFSAQKLDIAVIDRDNSSLSKALCDYLDKTHKLKSMKDDKEHWLDELFAHTVEYVLVIENGFEENLTSDSRESCVTSYSAPDSSSAYIVASQAETWLKNLDCYLDAGCDPDEAAAKASEITEISAETSYLNSTASEKTTVVGVFFHFMPYIVLCILINSLGAVLIIWNRSEIRSRTAVSGVSLRSRNWGIIGAMASYSAIVFAIIIGASACVYRKEFFVQSTAYHILNTLCCFAVCIAVTFLISQLSRKTTTLSIWSNLLGLSSSFLSGVFVSRSLLPDTVVNFSKCLPTYWYINVADELYSYNGSLSSLAWQSMGIQLLFAAAITAIAFVIVRAKQQKNS